MINATRNIRNSFLIESSFHSLGCSDEALLPVLKLGFSAYFSRNYLLLGNLGRWFLELSRRTENAGLFFTTLATGRHGKGDFSDSRAALEYIANHDTGLRATALVGITSDAFHYRQIGCFEESLLFESSKVATNSQNLLFYTQAQNNLSLLFSHQGDHKQSLKVLRGIYPAMYAMGRVFPAYYCDYLNSTAYELAMLGDYSKAHHLIKFVTASPYATAYPEWAETKCEIEAMAPREKPRASIYLSTSGAHSHTSESDISLTPEFFETTVAMPAPAQKDNVRYGNFQRAQTNVFNPIPATVEPIRKNFPPPSSTRFYFVQQGQHFLLCAVPSPHGEFFIELMGVLDEYCTDLSTSLRLEIFTDCNPRLPAFSRFVDPKRANNIVAALAGFMGKAHITSALESVDKDVEKQQTARVLAMIAEDESQFLELV